MDITRIGHADVFIGIRWLEKHNPCIDWAQRQITFDKPFCLQNCSAHSRRTHPIATFAEFLRPQTTPETIPREPHSVSFVSATSFSRTLKNSHAFVMYIREAPTSVAAALGTPGNPKPSVESLVPKEYHEYLDVFSEEAAAKLPERRPCDHKIPIEPGKAPPFGHLYTMSHAKLKELQSYLQENLSKGFIHASSSLAGAPVLFAKKKDGSLHLCVDYQGLNAITIKNRHPLPLITESLDRLAKAKFFTKINLCGAYTHIRIAEGDEWKTAFRTRYGHFEYLIMPFGLTNAPASFQAFMNDIFWNLMDVYIIIYLDDILVFSDTLKEHRTHVAEVLIRKMEKSI